MPTMADLLNAGHGRLTLGCPTLDAAMGGGVPTRCITELTGESTASKTQLCLQMLLTVSHSVSRAAVGDRRRTHRRYQSRVPLTT